MEEQRISRMYLKLITSRITGAWYALTGPRARRSALFPVVIIALIVLIPGLIYYAHMHAKFHYLRQDIQGQPAATGPQPGGQDPIVLTRTATPGAAAPEFLSVTTLPGLGMSILQITAAIPGRGETPLLVAPTVDQLADGTDPSQFGHDNLLGAPELPWGGNFAGVVNPVGTSITAQWHSLAINVPFDPSASLPVALGGLLHTRGADSASAKGRDTAVAQFAATDFDGHWPSRTATSVSVHMEATAIELTITATNAGNQPEPLGIGWRPRFALLGARGNVQLRLPDSQMIQYDDPTHPTGGRIAPPTPELQASFAHPATLTDKTVDAALVNLKPSPADSGVSAEIHNVSAHFGLRLTAESPSIREFRVLSPSGENFIALGAQTNYDDPFSHTWPEGQGIATLLPGQSIQYKVKLEIFPLPTR